MSSTDLATVDITRIVGKDSWIFQNRSVRIALTQDGGHMAPVTFSLPNGSVEPYYVSPWGADDLEVPADEPCVKFIRGDFFCLPFGNPSSRGEVRSMLHGEPSFERWQFGGSRSAGGVKSFEFHMRTTHPGGIVTKRIFLGDGHTAVYMQHELEDFGEAFPAGHHATLAMPEEHETVLVGLSAYRFGYTWPTAFGDPVKQRSYYALAVKERFEKLNAVPLIFKEPASGACDAFPTRRGYTDALACVSIPTGEPAWVTATFTTRGYLWFALKNADEFPLTLFWMANHGRHASPWNGRENCLGLEDTRSFFGEGWNASVEPNFLSADGVPTAFHAAHGAPIRLNYIQGVASTPPEFGRVTKAVFETGAVRFIDKRGIEARALVDHAFLRGQDAPMLTSHQGVSDSE